MQAALPAKAGSKPHKIKHPLGSRVPLYIMLAPFMILFFLFTILPILTYERFDALYPLLA